MKIPLARPRARYHSIQSTRPPDHGSRRSRLLGKDILVFCDGAGEDGRVPTGEPTNIWRLYQLAISPDASNSTDRQKEVVCLSGVGSEKRTDPLNLLSRIFGTTIVENIVAAYLHVAKHYQAGDRVYLFGYSRGAFVVRKVTSLTYRIGIVRTKEELLKMWVQHERPVPWNLFSSKARGTRILIESLVVWDTVGAIHSMPNQKKLEMDILGMPDDELTPNVQHAFHVVAFHENRKLFRVTLFNPKSTEDSRRLKEVWFPGAHSDVGGGGSGKLGLPNISLIWIIGELQSRCSLVIPHDKLEYPDLQTLAPSDSYRESAPWKRIVDKCETRLTLLKPSSLVHETVMYLRNLVEENLNPASKPTPYMLSINDLGRIGWDIKACLVARSAFETLKQANAHAQRKLKEQAGHYRVRITPLYLPGTPRAPTTTTKHAHNAYQQAPRSRLPSTTTDQRSTTPTPPYQVAQTSASTANQVQGASRGALRPQGPRTIAETNPEATEHGCVATPTQTGEINGSVLVPDPSVTSSQVGEVVPTSGEVLLHDNHEPSLDGAVSMSNIHPCTGVSLAPQLDPTPSSRCTLRPPSRSRARVRARSLPSSSSGYSDFPNKDSANPTLPNGAAEPTDLPGYLHGSADLLRKGPFDSTFVPYEPVSTRGLNQASPAAPRSKPCFSETHQMSVEQCSVENSPGDVAGDGMVHGEMDRTQLTRFMFSRLVEHGCLDFSTYINQHRYSECAVATGGFGDIWKGELNNGQLVAIKVWRLTSIDEDGRKDLKRCTREVYNWSKMDHENVHKLLGVLIFRGSLGMVSKWMDNGNLHAYIRKHEAVDRYDLCLQITRGLQYLHQKNFVHGDLKALNVLVSKEGIAKITDFDHSLLMDASFGFSETSNKGGGTVRWMAPELVLNEDSRRNKRTDMYALGMTLLEIITGEYPYSQYRMDAQIIYQLIQKTFPERTDHFQDARGQHAWNLLVKCWDHDPQARPMAYDVLQSFEGVNQGSSKQNRY